MKRLSSDKLSQLMSLPVAFPESGSHSVPFSFSSHVKYKPNDLKCEERTTSSRTGEFKKRLMALWWLNDEKPVPYAFRTADGSVRSMDAGCLGMLSLKKDTELEFILDGDGYICAVSPAASVIASWTDRKSLLLKQIAPH